MQTILRAAFPDTILDAALLESIAGLWLAWHLEARGIHFLPWHSFHRVEAHLWGVARPDIEACRAQFARQATREVPDSTITLADPDALTVTSPWREAAQASALARVVALFQEDEFEGMRLTQLPQSERKIVDFPAAAARKSLGRFAAVRRTAM